MNTKGVLPCRTAAGFTLIELLVVVLIIGILSAAALPQYQKAVAKSQATQALSMLKSVAQAYTIYYMSNGYWAPDLDDLDIQVPWTGSAAWKPGLKATRSTRDWSMQLQWIIDGGSGDLVPVIYIGRLTGPYQGTGFAYFFGQWDNKENWRANPHTMYCTEQHRGAGVVFTKNKGDFCQKVMNSGNLMQSGDTVYYYKFN